MKKNLIPFLILLLLCSGTYAQSKDNVSAQATAINGEQIITFRFVPGQDMFYTPWQGNNIKLNELYAIVERHRAEISSGAMPLYVNSYSASMRSAERNRELAFTRANRVKSELITKKGLVEHNFITKNYTSAYTDTDGISHKDMVVVTLRIPDTEKPVSTAYDIVKSEPQPVVEPEPQPIVDEPVKPEPQPESHPTVPSAPYRFAIRTNLLYDAFLTPTLGVEWRASRNLGFKLDGSFAYWGDEKGRVQKIWLVSPEVRWYMSDNKRFYAGASGNVGEYNIYKGMIGGLFSGDTGYQGKLWGAGLTVGYQLYLSRNFSLDFNLGLGYTRLEYDSFTISNETRVYKEKDKTRNFWGPTQAGVSLVWTIGGNK